jgi:diguanylate cyclase (GGDEF)-like protein/PAS domain S-box-containing protein
MSDQAEPSGRSDDVLDRFRLVFSRLPVPLALTGPDGSVQAANPEMLDLMGMDADALIGRSLLELTHPDDRAHSRAAVEQVRSGDVDRVQVDKRLMPESDGPVQEQVPVHVTVLRLDGDRFGFHRLVQVEAKVDLEKDELRRQAMQDPLTGLANRRALDRRVQPMLHGGAEQQPSGAGWALLFVDLDGFKAVNDVHGHRVGDALLVAVAERLAVADCEADLVSRIGGDEFVLLLCTGDPDRVTDAVDRVRLALAQPFDVEGHSLDVAVSVGVAVPRSADPAPRLLDRADADMYRDKRRRSEP